MKKIIMFMLLAISLAGCSCFDSDPKITIIGYGQIQNDRGLLFVEIDSMRYAVNRVHTGEHTRDGEISINATDGAYVTCFKRDDALKPEFVLGHLSLKEVQTLCHRNYTGTALFLFLAIFVLVLATTLNFANNIAEKHRLRRCQ